MGTKQTLIILNPEHFHAALTLREPNPLIDADIHVFAEDGPDLEHFLRLVQSFNERLVNPTRWTLYVYRGADYLEKLLAQRPGNVVIVAGRNNDKLPLIHRLHTYGFYVLGDKPWLIESGQLGLLSKVTANAPLAMDMMTERYEIANRVQKALAQRREIFGDFRLDGDQPAIFIRSVHHLYKMVNGQPLQRPVWYFDPAVQGEGITDVTTHLIDLVQWMTEHGDRRGVHVEQLSARQWPTLIPRAIFSRITGLEEFPENLRERLSQAGLRYLCNAALSYRWRGIPVRNEVIWNLEEPAGGGDLHQAVVRGSGADLVIDQGPETGFLTELTVNPVDSRRPFAGAMADAVASMQDEFPGLGFVPLGNHFRITIPKRLRTTHEQHFAAVLQTFLTYVEEGAWPATLGAELEAKYSLLARALDFSHEPGATAIETQAKE